MQRIAEWVTVYTEYVMSTATKVEKTPGKNEVVKKGFLKMSRKTPWKAEEIASCLSEDSELRREVFSFSPRQYAETGSIGSGGYSTRLAMCSLFLLLSLPGDCPRKI